VALHTNVSDLNAILSEPLNSDPRYWLPLSTEFKEMNNTVAVMHMVQECRIERLAFAGFLPLLNILANLTDDKGQLVPIALVFADPGDYGTLLPNIVFSLTRSLNISEQDDFTAIREIARVASSSSALLVVDQTGHFRDARRIERDVDSPNTCLFIEKHRPYHLLTDKMRCLLFRFEGDGRIYLFHNGFLRMQKSKLKGWTLKDTGALELQIRDLSKTTHLQIEVLSRLICVGLALAEMGRGAAFTLGDANTIMTLSHPLNPGLLIDKLSVNLVETQPEDMCAYAIPDGAIVVDESGEIVRIGMEFSAPEKPIVKMGSHTGTRHRAVARATASSKAVGLVVSAEDLQLTLFLNGNVFLEW
jgi:hypothetical protein